MSGKHCSHASHFYVPTDLTDLAAVILPRGLLGAHVMADLLRQRGERMQWYRDELLHMAKELGHRLLPAFNTTSGLPYPKVDGGLSSFFSPAGNHAYGHVCFILVCFFQVNLRYGVLNPLSRTGTESDTCTACAGTMILEFAALSRLSGESVFEVPSPYVPFKTTGWKVRSFNPFDCFAGKCKEGPGRPLGEETEGK